MACAEEEEEDMSKGKQPIKLTLAQVNRIKEQAVKEAVDKAFILLLLAAHDAHGLDDDQLCEIAKTADRYAGYVDDKLVRLREVQEILEKNTGIKYIGW